MKKIILPFTILAIGLLNFGAGCSSQIKTSTDPRIKDIEYYDKWITIRLNNGILPETLYHKELVPQHINDTDIATAQLYFGPLKNEYLTKNGHSKISELRAPSGTIRITEFDSYDGAGTAGEALDYLPDNLDITELFDPVISGLIDVSHEETIVIIENDKQQMLIKPFVIRGSKIIQI